MSDLDNRLLTDLKDAVRTSDTTRRDVLRYLRAEIHNVEIERGRPLDDDEVIAVIRRQIKQRRDSIEQFARGKRQDLVEAETAQIEVLQQYLPPEMSSDELVALAREVVVEVGATGPRDLGRVISTMRERVGPRADGSAVAAAAREALPAAGSAPRTP